MDRRRIPRAAATCALWSALLACDNTARPPRLAPDQATPGIAGASATATVTPRTPAAVGVAEPTLPASPAPAAASGGDAAAEPPVSLAADSEYLGLAAPKLGFRVVTRGLEIEPGADLEYCEVAELPGNPGEQYHLRAAELANARGSHHLIVSMAAPGSEADRRLRTLEIGAQVPCIGATQEYGREGLTILASTQTRYSKAELPDGVAHRMFGGQRLVFDYHYFNSGSEPLTAKSAMAVHLRDAGEQVTLLNSLAFTNMTIDTPAGTERTFIAACVLKRDAMLFGIARHTHRSGRDFAVWFEGGARHGEHVWTSTDWELDTDFRFPEPLRLRAGEGFKFACSFRNEGSESLRFGTSAQDEMCILGAAIWSPTPGLEIAPEECVITWIDAGGIGRDADDAGGFPPADPDDAFACHAGSLGLSLFEGCLGCICDACGSILARCNADAHCKALLDCNNSCPDKTGTACQQACEPVTFEHSSGVGMITQVGECIRASCGSACALSPAPPEAAP